MLDTLKWRVGRMLDSSPRVSFFAYSVLARCPALLPHDRSYLALPQLGRLVLGRHEGKSGRPLLLDIGANNGISARGFLKLLPGWRVHSVEPNFIHEANLLALRHKFKDRFTFTMAAAGNPDSQSRPSIALFTPLWRNLALHTVAATSPEVARQTAAEVWKLNAAELQTMRCEAPLIAIDELRLEPLIVKIDAEGSEKEILTGMKETLVRNKPIVLMEVTADECGSSSAFLRELGYLQYAYDDANDALHATDAKQRQHVTGQRNRYFIPAEISPAAA